MSLATNPRRLLATGLATLSAGAMLLAGAAGAAAAAPRAAAASGFSKTLTVVTPPGTLSSVTWTVPTGDALLLTNWTLQGSGGSVGTARVQQLVGTSSPASLLIAALGQLGKPSRATFRTPLVFRAGQSVALTIACDTNQAACKLSLAFSGLLVSASGLHNSGFFSNLNDVVAPATIESTSWTVPASHSFSLTDILASTNAVGLVGGLDLVFTPGGGKPRTLLRMTLAKLSTVPFDYQLSGPVTEMAGARLTLTVKCAADQAACNVDILFSGKQS